MLKCMLHMFVFFFTQKRKREEKIHCHTYFIHYDSIAQTRNALSLIEKKEKKSNRFLSHI